MAGTADKAHLFSDLKENRNNEKRNGGSKKGLSGISRDDNTQSVR